MRSEVIADIFSAVIAVTVVVICWDNTGNQLTQVGLVWAGASIGYLITVYLNQGEDE